MKVGFLSSLAQKVTSCGPTGIETAKRNYFPTDYELILCLFRWFSYQDLLILRAATETVKQFMGDFVNVDTIVHLCHKENCFTSPFWADE